MIGLGEGLTEEKYNEIAKGTALSVLSYEELIESAVNFDKFWEFAGTYYKLKAGSPIIIIDREQSVGGYNNSELTLLADENSVVSNDKEFQTYINAVIGSKEKTAKAQESEEDSLCI